MKIMTAILAFGACITFATVERRFKPGSIFAINESQYSKITQQEAVKTLNACDSFCVWETLETPYKFQSDEKISNQTKEEVRKLAIKDIEIIDDICFKTTIQDFKSIIATKFPSKIDDAKYDKRFQNITEVSLKEWENIFLKKLQTNELQVSIGDSIQIQTVSNKILRAKIVGINQFGINTLISDSGILEMRKFQYEDVIEFQKTGKYSIINNTELNSIQRDEYKKWKSEKTQKQCIEK